MDDTLQKEFNALQAGLNSLRESVEARDELLRRETNDRLVRRVTAQSAQMKSKQVWVIGYLREPSWNPRTDRFEVRWEEVDRIVVRPYERSFATLNEAQQHYESLAVRRRKEEQELRGPNAAA